MKILNFWYIRYLSILMSTEI